MSHWVEEPGGQWRDGPDDDGLGVYEDAEGTPWVVGMASGHDNWGTNHDGGSDGFDSHWLTRLRRWLTRR